MIVAEGLYNCIQLEKLVIYGNSITAESAFEQIFRSIRENYLQVTYKDFGYQNQLTIENFISSILCINLQSLHSTIDSSSITLLAQKSKNWENIRKLELSRAKFCNADIGLAACYHWTAVYRT